MTVTLTKEELEAFQKVLAEWYNKRLQFIIEGLVRQGTRLSVRDAGSFSGAAAAMKQQLMQLTTQFETENPKPDWRSLL